MRNFIAPLVLGLGLVALAQADGIYKWVDEDGVVHFGSQPPKKEQVEVVKAPKSERLKQWQQEQNALVAQRKLATAADSSAEEAPEPQVEQEPQPAQVDTSAAEMAARAQRCRSAQARLQELQSRPRVREVDASGNYRVLAEEERQQRIQQTKDVLQNNC